MCRVISTTSSLLVYCGSFVSITPDNSHYLFLTHCRSLVFFLDDVQRYVDRVVDGQATGMSDYGMKIADAINALQRWVEVTFLIYMIPYKMIPYKSPRSYHTKLFLYIYKWLPHTNDCPIQNSALIPYKIISYKCPIQIIAPSTVYGRRNLIQYYKKKYKTCWWLVICLPWPRHNCKLQKKSIKSSKLFE